MASLEVDFAVGGSVKWLCGGPGNGWAYVRPDLSERLEPEVTGWQAHAEPFAFEPAMRSRRRRRTIPHGHAERASALRGTAGYDLIEEIGVERIRKNSLRQTQRLIELADNAGLEVRSPRDAARRGGTVTLNVAEFPRFTLRWPSGR